MALGLPTARRPSLFHPFFQAVFRPYGQILFSRDPLVGGVVFLAIACTPKLALYTLGAIFFAGLGVALLGLGLSVVREGTVGCIAVLTTLALFTFAPDGGSPLTWVIAGSLASVLFAASFQAVFTNVALPTHALPFVAATWLVHLATRAMPLWRGIADEVVDATWLVGFLPTHFFAPSWLDMPAALIFGHGQIPGLLILIAIFLHSRVSMLLTLAGGLTVLGVRLLLREGQPFSLLDTTAFFNGALTAMALGGVWFVPQPSSLLLASVAAGISTLITFALFPLLGAFSLPVISLPFVVTVHLFLTAARMREQDRWPRSTIPADRPEEALARHLLRTRRFGTLAWLPFRLPFRGEWFVSQGHDGKFTHKGLWRHGLDFEGRTPDGKAHTGEGKELRDYVCYGLPVVAPGAGTVALVEDGVADNRPGELNLQENWGNAVVLQHGQNLFSVCAHLQPKSIRVKVGDVVTPGMEIARCGNSGRSEVPHLHFQIQRSRLLGSPTLAFDFGDVVLRTGERLELGTQKVPKEGDFVRPAQRDDGLARILSLAPGVAYLLEGNGRRERAVVEVDLHGTRSLRSAQGRLVFDVYENGLVFLDYTGSPSSLLRYLFLAFARLPFDPAPELRWKDTLSRRWFLPRWLRVLADLWIAAVPEFGKMDVEYRMRRQEGQLLILGQAESWKTHTLLSLAGKAHTLTIEHGGKITNLAFTRVEADMSEDMP